MTPHRFVLILLLALVSGISACRTFEEAVHPLVEPKAPPGYKPPVYMTGTVGLAEADPVGLTAEVWRVNSVPYPDSVQLFVRIYTPAGKLVTGLAPPYYVGAGDWRSVWNGITEQIGDDGTPAPISDFTVREFSDQDGIPYELSLVLDYSGTMGSNIKGLEDAALAFIRLKRPQDRISVVKFDRTPRVTVAPTTSQPELVAAFTGTGLAGFGGYTALYNAARSGGELVASAPPANPRALVLFTDGEDNASSISAPELYEYCRTQSIPIFTVAFGDVNREALGDISKYTGGRFYQAYTAEELRSVFEDIYRSLRNYYVVTYRPPFVPGKHIAQLRITLPKAQAPVTAQAIYNTITGDIIGPSNILTISDTVFFEYNRWEVREQAMPGLKALVDAMRENPKLRIEVRGHTDAVGTEEYNRNLSEHRATAVREAMLGLGGDPARLRSRGFGFDQPVASNDTEEGRQRNRRVEFVILAR